MNTKQSTILTSESVVRDLLQEIFSSATLADYDSVEPQLPAPMELRDLDWVATYADRGVRSGNAGLVVRFRDGEEYHIEIIQVR